MVEVDFGPNERQFKRYDLLEIIGQEQVPFDELRAGQFGTPSDLRRVLIFEKIKGGSTERMGHACNQQLTRQLMWLGQSRHGYCILCGVAVPVGHTQTEE